MNVDKPCRMVIHAKDKKNERKEGGRGGKSGLTQSVPAGSISLHCSGVSALVKKCVM